MFLLFWFSRGRALLPSTWSARAKVQWNHKRIHAVDNNERMPHRNGNCCCSLYNLVVLSKCPEPRLRPRRIKFFASKVEYSMYGRCSYARIKLSCVHIFLIQQKRENSGFNYSLLFLFITTIVTRNLFRSRIFEAVVVFSIQRMKQISLFRYGSVSLESTCHRPISLWFRTTYPTSRNLRLPIRHTLRSGDKPVSEWRGKIKGRIEEMGCLRLHK